MIVKMEYTEKDFLPIVFVKVKFQMNMNPRLEADLQDMANVFDFFGVSPLNIIKIKTNNFFATFKSVRLAHLAYKYLNNFVLEELNLLMSLRICRRGQESSFTNRDQHWKATFEIEVPHIDYFNVEERFLGKKDCNMKRIVFLCEREYFEGHIDIQILGNILFD